MTKQEFFEFGLIGAGDLVHQRASQRPNVPGCRKDKALLVDTGMGVGDLAALVRSLTPLPVIVVNTHGHPDHAGGNGGFDEFFLHPADEPIMKKMCTEEYRQND